MFNLVLIEPEIPPNTGNIIRLAANTGCRLHLVKPFGFELDDKRLRRAGLDYREWVSIITYQDWPDFLSQQSSGRLFAISTKGQQSYASVAFAEGDYLIFGPETRGLSSEIRQNSRINSVLRIPMQPNSRSMNLSNAVSVLVYEAWRQQGFSGAQ
ncbi:MAG: tRNA (cytidine/uridine-2'-O-)-methyltransferase [Cellvibrionaceae bacterium]|jgi:tRNA (cytidine/uridine-2'-O-)-methyltransferase